MSEKKTIILQSPVTVGERTVSELHFPTDPEFGLLEAIDKAEGSVGRMFYLIAAATGEPVHIIKKIKPIDINPVMEVAQELLGELMPQNPSQSTSDV